MSRDRRSTTEQNSQTIRPRPATIPVPTWQRARSAALTVVLPRRAEPARGGGEGARRRSPLTSRGLLAARWGAQLGAGDVLVTTTKQDGSDSSNPSEYRHDRGRETSRSRVEQSCPRRRGFPLRGGRRPVEPRDGCVRSELELRGARAAVARPAMRASGRLPTGREPANQQAERSRADARAGVAWAGTRAGTRSA